MDTTYTETLERGQRVVLATKPFAPEIDAYTPLHDARVAVAAVVTAIEAKQAAQDTDTKADTAGKDAAREGMARAADVLSNRAVAYALVKGDAKLKRLLTLAYADVRYGEETEDLNAVRALVATVQGLPAPVRTDYRLTPKLITDAADAAENFVLAGQGQTVAKADTRLATLSLPELVEELRLQLEIMRRLTKGMRGENQRWADLSAAFADANKRRLVAADRRLSAAPKVVKRLQLHRADAQAVRLDKQNYGPAYELTIKNESPTDLLLWMSFEKLPGGAPVSAFRCPGGQTSTVTRAALGPETARYLTGQFADAAGGEVRITVRRVVA